MTAWLTRLELGGIAALLLACGLVLGAGTMRSPEIAFVFADGPGTWLMALRPLRPNAIAIDPAKLPVTSFEGRFTLAATPATAAIELRAMREVALFVNGQPVELGHPADWKQISRHDVSGPLVAGENTIRADVTNAAGPALFQLRLEAPGLVFETDERWTTRIDGGPPYPAARADDTRPYPDRASLPTPFEELLAHAAPVLVLFAIGAGTAWLVARRGGGGAAVNAPTAVALALSGFWLALFVAKLPLIPLRTGFDVMGHLQYVNLVRARHALPLASEGWSTYHPPLFYVLSAGLLGLFDPAPGGAGERLLHRLVPFLAGLGNVWVARAAAQRFFPGDPVRAAFAVGFAGLVPMSVYMSAYVSNEPLHGVLAGGALLAASVLLLEPGGSPRWAAATGALLGLALLTKVTSVLLVPCVAFFVAAKLFVVDRARAGRALGHAALIAGVALAIAGWHYARHWIAFGDPFVLNLGAHNPYWQQPGFHTPAYYRGLGGALSHPWFAGFHSFWGGLYTTLWGDGFVGGAAVLRDRHPAWNYAFVSIGYLLALPATGLLALGFARCVAGSLRGDDGPARVLRAFHTTVLFGIGFSVLYMTLRLPFWGQTKAFYGLCALLPLALVAGEGFGWLHDLAERPRWRWLRLPFWGWLTALAGVIVLSFLA